MAEKVGVVEDEESLANRSRIQPFSSTPMSEKWKTEEGEKHNPTILGERLGLDDFFSLKVWQASVAELVGTAVYVFMLDTIAISSYETKTKTPNLVVSFLVSLTVTIVVFATFPISGGHINPLVSFFAALMGLISFSRAAIYTLAQCTGAVLGALALKAVVSSTIEDTFSLGGCTITIISPGPNGPTIMGLETGQALWLEIICTFVFLYASIGIAFDDRQAKALGPVIVCMIIGIVVGLVVFVATTVTATKGYAGVGMNPARCVGPALVRGGHLWNGHWVFWVGPAIACLAFYMYKKIIPHQHFHAREQKYDFFNILEALLMSGGDHK